MSPEDMPQLSDDRPSDRDLGCYGLRLELPALASSLVEVEPAWPSVEVTCGIGRPALHGNSIDERAARFELQGEGLLEVDAGERTAVFTTPREISDEELLHPYLAPVGAAFAWWNGHEAFHAGAVTLGDARWALIGDKGQGKSTALGYLAIEGHDVACDDMLVVAGGEALAGPRCVDLREPAAQHLGVGELVLRPEPRWRLRLGAVPAAQPLGGWFFLRWGSQLGARSISARELLPLLATNRSMALPARDPLVLLDLSVLPAWELTVPRDLARLPDLVAQLVQLAGTR